MSRKTPLVKSCEHCKIEFSTLYPKTRFCSKRCAAFVNASNRIYSAEAREKARQTILKKYQEDPSYKERVSNGLKRYYEQHPECIVRGKKHSLAVGKGTKGKQNKCPESIYEVSSRTMRKILTRLEISCSRCNWNEAVCDLHHIRGRKIPNANNHDNLTYICPNCHRLFHSGIIDSNDIKNLKDHIGDRWKEYYYG